MVKLGFDFGSELDADLLLTVQHVHGYLVFEVVTDDNIQCVNP